MGAEKRTASEKAAFKRELTDVVPHLRAFARGLCGRADMADDLVQEALLKAWAAQERFEPGTSMRAWTFVILLLSIIGIVVILISGWKEACCQGRVYLFEGAAENVVVLYFLGKITVEEIEKGSVVFEVVFFCRDNGDLI